MHRCWLAMMVGLALSCSSDAVPDNVLIVSIDTLRADHSSAYGYTRDTTPNLRLLAEQGVLFEAAFAPSATTGPSHASIFTGRYPLNHGVVKNGLSLDPGEATLAELARTRGFDTAAFVSSYVLDARFGFAQGFDTYDDDFVTEESTLHLEHWAGEQFDGAFDRRADITTDAALAWLAEHVSSDAGRFLLFVHYFDPHDPYDPPSGYESQFAPPNPVAESDAMAEEVLRYDQEIAFVDAELGRLLDGLASLGIDRETLVVVVGDHGEGRGDHGVTRHGVHIYDAFVRVPLIVRAPGIGRKHHSIARPVSLVDLFPTLAEIMRLPVDADLWPARSLVPAITGRGELEAVPVFLERRHYEPGEVEGHAVAGQKFGIRTTRWKYLEAPDEGTRELYDLTTDPGERHDLSDADPANTSRLRSALDAWRRAGSVDRTITELPPDARRRLEALGYAE